MYEITEAFLRTLYSSALTDPELHEACITLWTLPDKRSVHLPLGDITNIAKRAVALDAEGKDVYFGVALRYPGLPPERRGTKEELVASCAFWLDIDIASGAAHAAKNLPTSIAEAESILEALGEDLQPDIIVHSGHGLHAYFCFADVAPLLSDEHVAAFERDLLALQQKAKDAAAQSGWHVDILADAPRVLRLPGTHNHKAS